MYYNSNSCHLWYSPHSYLFTNTVLFSTHWRCRAEHLLFCYFNTSVDFFFTVPTESKLVLLSSELTLKERNFTWCQIWWIWRIFCVVMCLSVKNYFTNSAMWADALSWWRMKTFFIVLIDYSDSFSQYGKNFLIINTGPLLCYPFF